MSRKFFAMAKIDNSFIVSAETEEALTQKITDIREKHPEYYRKFVVPGYYVVEADSIRNSKTGSRSLAFDLPLFTTATFEYLLMDAIPGTSDFAVAGTFPTLQLALQQWREKSPVAGQIRVRDNTGTIVKSFDQSQIAELLEKQEQEERQKTRWKTTQPILIRPHAQYIVSPSYQGSNTYPAPDNNFIFWSGQ